MSAIEIKNILQKRFTCADIDVIDETMSHKGHAAWKPGISSHFKLKISSSEFDGMSKIQIHKMIHKSLEKQLKTYIHALSIEVGSK